MHDAERRCDSSRRHVSGSEARHLHLSIACVYMGVFNCLLHIVFSLTISQCLFYVNEPQVQARRQRRGGPHAPRRALQFLELSSAVPRPIFFANFRGEPYRAPSLPIISRSFADRAMPPVIQAILSAARHAQEGGTMAGLLLRVDSRVRGKWLASMLFSSRRCKRGHV